MVESLLKMIFIVERQEIYITEAGRGCHVENENRYQLRGGGSPPERWHEAGRDSHLQPQALRLRSSFRLQNFFEPERGHKARAYKTSRVSAVRKLPRP
jgi:hypothetical protein